MGSFTTERRASKYENALNVGSSGVIQVRQSVRRSCLHEMSTVLSLKNVVTIGERVQRKMPSSMLSYSSTSGKMSLALNAMKNYAGVTKNC